MTRAKSRDYYCSQINYERQGHAYGDMDGQFKEWRTAHDLLESFRKVPRNLENFRLQFNKLTDEDRAVLLNFYIGASTDDEMFHLICCYWSVKDTIENE